MRATNTQPTVPSSEMTMLDVLRIMHDAEKLQKRAAREPRQRSPKYVLLLWDSEGNQYGTGRHAIFTKDEADRLFRDLCTGVCRPASGALWNIAETELIKTYENKAAVQ